MEERAIARRQRRSGEIEAAVADVREIERRSGVTRESLDNIKQRLIRLAAHQELFTARGFPPPEAGGYVNSSFGDYGTPAHNHTTLEQLHRLREARG